MPTHKLGNLPSIVIPPYAAEELSKDGIVLNVYVKLLMKLSKNRKDDFKLVLPLKEFAEEFGLNKKTIKPALERLHELNIIRYRSAEELRSRSFEVFIHIDPKLWKIERMAGGLNDYE